MPIYEYRCAACGNKHESLRKFSDPPLTECPKCGKGELVKLVSAAGFQLKGTGWYQTDFRSGGSKPAAETAKDKSASADAGVATKPDSDAKPESAKTTGASDAKTASTVSPPAGGTPAST